MIPTVLPSTGLPKLSDWWARPIDLYGYTYRNHCCQEKQQRTLLNNDERGEKRQMKPLGGSDPPQEARLWRALLFWWCLSQIHDVAVKLLYFSKLCFERVEAHFDTNCSGAAFLDTTLLLAQSSQTRTGPRDKRWCENKQHWIEWPGEGQIHSHLVNLFSSQGVTLEEITLWMN